MAGATSGSGDQFWGRKSLVVVTGGSRGIGRSIAVEFARNLANGSTIVITGRNAGGLEETKQTIGAVAQGVTVIKEVCDHSTASYSDYEELLKRNSKFTVDPEKVILVHNAATLGDPTRYAVSYNDAKEIDDYMHLNLTSIMLLTSAFLKYYATDSGPARVIINITSAAATNPFHGLGLYCCGKSAREQYLNVLAVENPSLKILHYSPGPVKTDMYAQVGKGVDELREQVKGTWKDALTPETTVAKLIEILRLDKFESGARIDYFDRT